ncbi:Hypothetical predicted protein [Podarcis lilfordi]|uniref:Uncharacterized protein n=1 Tax=Podarcis lilfordi TaxID=74358 RepID=A0AA35PGY7_9SAUR|nr:Hypothetical predicted protein [Podarcis lilfordi]
MLTLRRACSVAAARQESPPPSKQLGHRLSPSCLASGWRSNFRGSCFNLLTFSVVIFCIFFISAISFFEKVKNA